MNSFKTLLHNILPKKDEKTSQANLDVLQTLISVQVDKAGTLSQHIDKVGKSRISRLKVNGDLNSTDVRSIREMPHLEVLDLADARIVVGGDYYMKALYCQNEEDAIGLYMFHRNATLREITFPKDVRVVRAFAFRRCVSLSDVHFSEVVEQIGERAFSYCEALGSIQFPESLKSIREMAFTHCMSLRSVELPDSVDNLGDYVFADCPVLLSVSLSSSLQNVGSGIFAGCTRLSAIHAKGVNPAFAKSSSFEGVNVEACILYVPKGQKEKYATANGWKVFKRIVEE